MRRRAEIGSSAAGGKKNIIPREASAHISNDNEAAHFASGLAHTVTRTGSPPFRGAGIPIDFNPSRGTREHVHMRISFTKAVRENGSRDDFARTHDATGPNLRVRESARFRVRRD